MQHRRTILLAGAAIALIAGPVFADPWYEHYANAERALEQQDWTVAVEQINAALEKKGDSGARVRSYGMNVVAYFPYFRLGVAYYHLGQYDAALQAFDTETRLGAIAESETANAELSRFRSLAEDAKAAQAEDEQRRIRAIVADNLALAARLEVQGQVADAIGAVDKALAVAPDDEHVKGVMSELRQRLADQQRQREVDRREAALAEQGPAPESGDEAGLEQRRLLELRYQRQAEADRKATIERLLNEASSRFEAGSMEESLAAANQVLALDPGNTPALEQIARAYAVISRRLLGARPGGNIPPAVRFVDLREENDDGLRVQTTGSPDFRLNGVIIDESPVKVSVSAADTAIEPVLNSQSIGDFTLTEFSVALTLPPGESTLRLVASDKEGLSSSSEYAVVYAQPLIRKAWFQALLLSAAILAVAVPAWRGYRRRAELRRRKFNPYVAGAPVFGDEMFFGRRDLINRILQTIHNNSLLLYGERRIGKTSLQHQLKRRLLGIDDPNYEFHPVYIDLQGTPQEQFFRTIAEDIVEELAPTLDGLALSGSTPSAYNYRDFVGDLRAVIRYLQSKSSRTVKLVLLIDEVDELNDYDPRINQRLRSLFMKNFAENLVAVVSGVEIKKRWEREGSPWYNFFEEIEVTAFNPQEARELIRKPIDGIFKFDADAVDRVISLTGGRPYPIQKMCGALVTRLHEQHRRRITAADVDAVAGTAAAPTKEARQAPGLITR